MIKLYMSDVYCGIGKIPKNSRRGTPKECLNSNQVRYYGIEKIDQNEFKKSASGKKIKKLKENVKKHIVILRVKKRKTEERIEYEKDNKKKEKLKHNAKVYTEYLKELLESLKLLNQEYPD